MTLTSRQSVGIYLLSLVAAMLLSIIPWPTYARSLNPDWVLLLLVYWAMAAPERIGIFNAWAVGLLVDVLSGRLLGDHALAYSLAIYLCIRLHKRLRHFPLFQQDLFVLGVLLIAQSLHFWIENSRDPARVDAAFWFPVLTGALCWPLVYGIMRKIRLPTAT